MGEVIHRTAWCNRVRNGSKERILFLPWYTVVVEDVGPNFFEPVDCLKRRSLATEETGLCSRFAQKEINEIKDFFWSRQAGMSDEYPGQDDMTIHSFDWDWPK